ncbi:MAG: sigma-70 family RNA polymerase sigma factor [Candidatus Riflebacteria bacterium]|nr:sigma-70 family RNA polymerase sigma factor [Candidatus Riflebacteria bacterium]
MFIIFSQPEIELVKMVKGGHKASFNALVRQTIPGLIGFFKYLGVPFQQMDDLVQETYLRAYQSLNGFDTSKSFFSWLSTIGRHVLIDQKKKTDRFHFIPENVLPEPTFEGEEQVEKRQMIRDLLKNLSDEARFLIELRIFQELPFSEIAQITGEAEGSLRVRFHRILENLRGLAKKGDSI